MKRKNLSLHTQLIVGSVTTLSLLNLLGNGISPVHGFRLNLNVGVQKPVFSANLQDRHASRNRVTHLQAGQTTMDDKIVINGNQGTLASESLMKSIDKPRNDHYDALITGAGPAGLLTAIMLSKRYGPNYKIAICEKRSSIPPKPSDESVWSDVARFYLLGIGFRGQNALEKFCVLEEFEKNSVPILGRRDWQPGTGNGEGVITPAKKDVTSRIIARDRLVGVLHHYFLDNYANNNPNIDVLYGHEVQVLSFDEEAKNRKDSVVKVQIVQCVEEQDVLNNPKSYVASQEVGDELCDVESARTVTASLLIGADGSARTIANSMEEYDKNEKSSMKNPLRKLFYKPFKVTRYNDDNPRIFKSIPVQLPKDWPQNLNYSARSNGSRMTLEALPSDNNGNLCALLLLKPDDPLAQPNTDGKELRSFFDEEFPQFSALISDDVMETVAKKPSSPLPAFRYAGPKLHIGDNTMILGDSAHTVKPYYGLGANSAMEDVVVLSDCLDETKDNVSKAISLFSEKRASDSEAMVSISRNMDRPGKLFFINFLIPLILDGIFSKLAPKIFAPNMFQMFQRRDIGFTQIRNRKRLDRVMQSSVILTTIFGIFKGIVAGIGLVSRYTGKSKSVVAAGMASFAIIAAYANKMMNSKGTEKTAKA